VFILTSGPFISVFIIIIIRPRVTISVRLSDRLNVGVCFTHRSRTLSSHVLYVVYFMKISQRRDLIPQRLADQLTGARSCVIASRGDVMVTASADCLVQEGRLHFTPRNDCVSLLVYTFNTYLTAYYNTVNIRIHIIHTYCHKYLCRVYTFNFTQKNCYLVNETSKLHLKQICVTGNHL